jgi:dephospho-CoA kinase
MPLRVGLTGGIASGKSMVADIFAELGAAIIDTDVIAREVVAPGQPALEEIASEFGASIVDADGVLDRDALRQLIFADDEARTRLEAILHPRIGVETHRQADTAGGEYQLIVVPLLVNSALRSFVDRVLVVDCDEETQIRRLTARDGETEDQARRILAAQASRSERLAIADDIISNDGTVANLRQQVAGLHEIYRTLT